MIRPGRVGLLAATLLGMLPGSAASAAVIPGFEVACSSSHASRDDPIVFPRRPGASPHLHEFFGNTGSDAYSTPASLRTSGGTPCALAANRTAYWSPAVYSAGVRLTPLRLHAYYRWGRVRDLASISALPAGAVMIAGDSQATRPPPTSVLGWSCGRQGERLASRPKDCRNTHHGRHGT